MSLEIFDVEQNTDDWLTLRAGLQTASMFADVMAKVGPRGGIPKGRQTYLYKLAGERLTGVPMDSYSNANMQRGHDREDEAARTYAFLKGRKPQKIGFIRNGNCGCSPDRGIGKTGLLEIKDAFPHIQIARLLDGKLPPEHKAQCQGQLMVSERKYVDFMSHCRGLAPLIIRVRRDEEYIKEIETAVYQFIGELDVMVENWRKAA